MVLRAKSVVMAELKTFPRRRILVSELKITLLILAKNMTILDPCPNKYQ